MKLRCNGSDIGWLQHREGHIITDSISCIQISIHIYLSYSLNLTVHLNSLSCQCSERVSSNYSCFSEVSQLFWPLMPSWWNVHILNPLTKSLCCSQRILKSTLPFFRDPSIWPHPKRNLGHQCLLTLICHKGNIFNSWRCRGSGPATPRCASWYVDYFELKVTETLWDQGKHLPIPLTI